MPVAAKKERPNHKCWWQMKSDVVRICAHDFQRHSDAFGTTEKCLFSCIYNPQITISSTSLFSANFNGNRVKNHPKPWTCLLKRKKRKIKSFQQDQQRSKSHKRFVHSENEVVFYKNFKGCNIVWDICRT